MRSQSSNDSLGTHSFIVRAFFSEAPGNYIDSSEFFVTISGGSCSSATITSASVDDQEYTITDAGLRFSMRRNFAVLPSFCATQLKVYHPIELNGYLSFNEVDQTFAVRQISDSLALSGST